MQSLHDGAIEQEPSFTDRMLGRIEEAMTDYRVKGISWRAKTLTDRGRGSQESRLGADFAGVLSVDIEDYSVRKGFLAQAKLIEPYASWSGREQERLRDQVEKMLELSPASFVFLYSRSGIKVVPGLAVLSAGHVNPHELYSRGIGRFFEEHFESFLGDRRVSAASTAVLEDLRRQVDARSLLWLEARNEY